MRGVRQAQVRAYRAHRWYLSREAPDARTALAGLPPLSASPAAYLSLRARGVASPVEALHELVFEERSLKAFPWRGAGDLLLPAEALPASLALHAFATGSRVRRSRTYRRIEAAFQAAAPLARKGLTSRPQTLKEIDVAGALERRVRGLGAWRAKDLLDELARRGEVEKGFQARGLTSSTETYALPRAADRVPARATEGHAFLAEVALRYFRTAGPATRDDFLRWASISRSAARHSIEDLAGLLEEVDLEGAQAAHFMLEEDASELRSGRFPPSRRVSLLPALDPVGWSTRKGFLAFAQPAASAAVEPRRRPGRARWARQPMIVGDGFAGLWQWDVKRSEVRVDFAAPPSARDAEEAAGRAADLAKFLDGDFARVAGLRAGLRAGPAEPR